MATAESIANKTQSETDETINYIRFRGIKKTSSYLRCLMPLLDALNWKGLDRDLIKALPAKMESMDQENLLGTMTNLNYEGRVLESRLNRVDTRLLPCLFVRFHQEPKVLIREMDNSYLVFDGRTGKYEQLPASSQSGRLIYFKPSDEHSVTLQKTQKNWFWMVVNRFKNLLILAAFITLLLSVFSFITPLFIMSVYDQLATADSAEMLVYLGAGILIFLVGDIGFRLIRTHLFSFVSIRMGNIAGNEILRRILYLPPEFTESASTGSQLSRIKDFDSIQNFLGGQPILAAYDLPFTFLLIFGLIFLGGNLALVPLVAVIISGLFFWIARPFMRRAVEEASTAGAKRHEFLIDFMSHFRAVKLSDNGNLWSRRYRELSSDVVLKSYAIAQITTIINSGSSFLVSATGLATMMFGIIKVLNGDMSSGALMASILLVWRILAPLRSGFGVLNQIGKIQKSIAQLNRLMMLNFEKANESGAEDEAKIRGRVRFSQVSMRYSADSNPALLNINFEVAPGELMAITGPDGTGKSTILKLIMGLYQSQTGRITIGNINVRQLNPISLRHVIGYSPAVNEPFDGTVAENLLLAKPDATDDELFRAAETAGILENIENMENGFDTPLKAGDESLDRSFMKAMGLAQIYLRKSTLYLLNEPEKGLVDKQLQALLKGLDRLKERDAVIVTTHSREILETADSILWLENNRVKLYGTPQEVLPKMDK